VAGLFQLGHERNGNFIDFITVHDIEGANVGNVGRFLTKFARPKYFEGYPFFLSYISPREFNGNPINGVAAYINGSDEALPSFNGMDAFIKVLSLQPDQVTNNIYLSVGGTLGEQVFDDTFDDTFWGTADEGAFALTERLNYDAVCVDNYKNPLCLIWENTLGGWDVWVFNKPVATDVYSGDEYSEKPVDSLLQNDFGELTNGTLKQSINLVAPKVSNAEYDALKELHDSPRVYWWKSPTDWQQIKVNPQRYNKKAGEAYYDFTVEIDIFNSYRK
jgi:phage-related protein